MPSILRDTPVILWVAAVWVALALWAEDVRGLYIAVACLLVGVVQIAMGTDRPRRGPG